MTEKNGTTPASASQSRAPIGYGTAGIVATPAQTGKRLLPHITMEHAMLLEGRGLDTEQCLQLGIVSVNVPGGGDWLAFQFAKNGKVVNRKYRRLDEKDFRQDKGGEQCWWNYDCLLDSGLKNEPLIITEGEFDAVAAIQSGFRKTVSVPGGAPDKPVSGDGPKYAFLADSLPLLRDVREIILATDGDRPGVTLMNDLAIRLGKGRCRYIRYPDGCKDLNDILLNLGPAAVVEAVHKSEWVKVSGLFLMSGMPPVEDAAPHDTGMPGLAGHYNVRLGDFCVITGIPGHGKALALDTPIPTPDGWATMGILQVGDAVYDERGEPCRVTAATGVMVGRPCYRMTFDGGTQVVADAEHQWLTVSERARRSAIQTARKRGDRDETLPRGRDQRGKRTFPSIVTTEQIEDSLFSQGKRNHHVPRCAPVAGCPSLLPVDPYTLGAWLGDGDSAGGRLTCFDGEIIERIAANGIAPVANQTAGRFGLPGLKRALRFIGVLDNKHIPELYQNASRGQRWDLLRGLMDTDGSAHVDRTCEFTSCNERLAQGVLELACGLGLKATLNRGHATLDGRVIGPKYRVRFVSGEPVFTMPRKLARQGVGIEPRINAHIIVNCEAVDSVPVRCIQVDSPSHLFLCTRSFIPTHNSTLVNDIACRTVEKHDWRACFASFEQHPQIDHKRALIKWRMGTTENQLSHANVIEVNNWIDSRFSFVIPDEDEDATVEWILEKLAAAVVRYGAEICVIDPWNELDHARPKDMSLTEYVGHSIREFKKFARRWNVHMIVVAHPTKISRGTDGKLPMPTLYDISDCYSDDTEVLTKRGWRRHADLEPHDIVMCYDPATGANVWQWPQRIVRHEFDGTMLNFKGYGYDLLVSPNHRMVVKPAWVEPVGSQAVTGVGRPVRWPKDRWSFIEARELAATGSSFKLPKAGLAIDGDRPDRLVIDGRDFPAAEFLELVGWWIAEGCFQSSGASLCQAVGPGAQRIDALIAACGLEVTRAVREDPRGFRPMVTWYFGARACPEVVRWLRDKAGDGAAEKRVPYPVFELHPFLKASLLNGYIAGDGHRPKDRMGASANTTSRQLFDDLQRLAVELGIPVCGHQRRSANERHSPGWQVNFGTELRHEVAVRSSRNVTSVEYQGNIWCLTVPTGAYFVRRNGKVAVAGNSAHWYNKPDVGIIVHRDEFDTLVKIAKSRYHDSIGKPGVVSMRYSELDGKYYAA